MVIPPPATISSSRIKALELAAKSSSFNSPNLARNLLARHRNPLLLNPSNRSSKLRGNSSRWGQNHDASGSSNRRREHQDGQEEMADFDQLEGISLHRNSRAARFGSKRLGAVILNRNLRNATEEMVQGEWRIEEWMMMMGGATSGKRVRRSSRNSYWEMRIDIMTSYRCMQEHLVDLTLSFSPLTSF